MALVLSLSDDQLKVRDTSSTSFVVVRGAPGYVTSYDPTDPLHQALDQLDPATVSKLFDGSDDAFLNPKNSRTQPSIDFARAILDANP